MDERIISIIPKLRAYYIEYSITSLANNVKIFQFLELEKNDGRKFKKHCEEKKEKRVRLFTRLQGNLKKPSN